MVLAIALIWTEVINSMPHLGTLLIADSGFHYFYCMFIPAFVCWHTRPEPGWPGRVMAFYVLLIRGHVVCRARC